jgi:hypothetical protein
VNTEFCLYCNFFQDGFCEGDGKCYNSQKQEFVNFKRTVLP